MASVTQRISQIQQPRGGYVPVKSFSIEKYDDGNDLGEENVSAGIIGLAVDYLTRFISTKDASEAFKISLHGARLVNKEKYAYALLDKVKGADDNSIIATCQLVGFDVCVRAGVSRYKAVENILPDDSTIRNIRIMLNRSLSFFEKYGPIVKDGMTFEGGYTSIVNAGDGDFLTKDTLWDFKVSKSEPKKEHTLQILMYYIMGTKSIHKEFDNIEQLGLFNPRLNKVYTIRISEISNDIIKEVADNVIGYAVKQEEIMEAFSDFKVEDYYMSAAEAASILGVSKAKVYRLIRLGEIKATKRGNKYLIEPEELRDYIDLMERNKRIMVFISLFMIGFWFLLMIWIFL